jgi:quinol monooxygenase YgiN
MGIVFLTGYLVCSDHDQVEVVAQHLPLHVELTRAEDGCISFQVNLTQNPLVWQVDEQLPDSASFRSHQQRVAVSEWDRATAASSDATRSMAYSPGTMHHRNLKYGSRPFGPFPTFLKRGNTVFS